MFMDDLYKQRREEEQRRLEEEKRQKADLDDGSVKGHNISGDYNNIRYHVEFQNTINEEKAFNLVTLFKKKKKKEDIILYIEVPYNNECGFVFTEDKIYSFIYSNLENVIEYSNIAEADFNEDSVIITLSNGEETTLDCGGFKGAEEYSKHMYNLIMDIVDRVKKA